MDVTDEVLGVVPHALRAYSLAFPLLVFNVSSTYCFQAVGWPLIATIASLMRGLVVPAVFAFALPVLFGPGAVWFAVPAGELITLVFVLSQLPLVFMFRRSLGLPRAFALVSTCFALCAGYPRWDMACFRSLWRERVWQNSKTSCTCMW